MPLRILQFKIRYTFLFEGDGVIDIEEFEYVLSDFHVPAKNARAAFIIFSKVSFSFFQFIF